MTTTIKITILYDFNYIGHFIIQFDSIMITQSSISSGTIKIVIIYMHAYVPLGATYKWIINFILAKYSVKTSPKQASIIVHIYMYTHVAI